MAATGIARLASAAASTNAALVSPGATKVLFVVANNTADADRYLKLYDKATAPTVGTDVPKMTIGLPPGAFALEIASGVQFQSGLGYALTGAAADNDTTALTAADVTGLNIGYA
jgi:hypothetical protein